MFIYYSQKLGGSRKKMTKSFKKRMDFVIPNLILNPEKILPSLT
jgi:hypothetical protein